MFMTPPANERESVGRVTAERRARIVVVAAFSGLGVAWGAWGAVLPGVRDATGASESEIGLALLFVAVGAVPAMLATSRLLVRWPRATLPAALVLLGAAFATVGASSSVAQLAAALFVTGAFSGLVDVAANIVTTRLAAVAGRSLLQLGHGSFSASVVVAALATGVARDSGAGPLAVLGMAAVVIGALATVVWSLTPSVAPSPVRLERDRQAIGRPIVLLGVLAAVALAIESGFQTWSAEHLERVLDARPTVGGAATAIFAAGMATGRFAAHRHGPRIGDPGLFRIGSFVAAVGTVVTSVAPAPWVALAGIAVAGVGVSVIFPLLVGQAARRSPGGAERAVSAVSVIGYTGFLVSPPLMGAAAQPWSLRVSFAVLAVLGVGLALAGPRVTVEPM
jgi:predicted MFS family arabinose efflux permease